MHALLYGEKDANSCINCQSQTQFLDKDPLAGRSQSYKKQKAFWCVLVHNDRSSGLIEAYYMLLNQKKIQNQSVAAP